MASSRESVRACWRWWWLLVFVASGCCCKGSEAAPAETAAATGNQTDGAAWPGGDADETGGNATESAEWPAGEDSAANASSAPEALRLATGPEGQRLLYRLDNGSYPAECGGGVACFPKCCPPGQILREMPAVGHGKTTGSACVPVDYVPFDPVIVTWGENTSEVQNLTDWPLDSYYLVIGKPCELWTPENFSLIDIWSTGELFWYVDMHTTQGDIKKPHEFCLEYSENSTEAFICVEPDPPKFRAEFSWLYTSGFVVSISGLLLTMIVYLAVDSLRDLHGKSLICHVGCLAVAYVLLAAVQLSGDANFGPDVCRSMAFSIQFFLLGSFLWLHVMCLDSFWCVLEATGCSPIPYPRAKKWVFDECRNRWFIRLEDEIDEVKEEERRAKHKRIERRVFLGYCIYVGMFSILPLIVVLVHNLSPTIPATYVDHNMKLHCAIDDDKTEESLLYFYPYTSIFILFNIIIFICILIKAIPFRWNPTGAHRVPRQKARMVFLLFVLMSSNWVIDLISWALGGQQVVWVMLHAFYILEGLITFLIFVLEDRVKDRIKHNLWPQVQTISYKYGCCHRPRIEDEEEAAISLKNNRPINYSQPLGWVTSNN